MPLPESPTGISFAGKTVVVTGATSGLGFEAAIKLLNLGVDCLIIGSRNLERGQATKAELELRTNRPGVVHVWELEMSSFQSVMGFAARVNTGVERLDVVLLNAGLWNRSYTTSSDGWEGTLQVNTLSTSLLAILLLPKLRSSSSPESPSHLSVVSSQLFTKVKADSLRTEDSLLEHLNDPQRFNGPQQYRISKLLMEYVLKTVALHSREENGSVPVIINTVSPGFCASSLGRQYDRFYERWMMWLVYKLFARTAVEGSRSLVSATHQGVESHGKCWRNDGYVDESNALTAGEEGKQLQAKAFEEIFRVLRQLAPEVEEIIQK
ncbi:hypothetical protein CNMCM5793_003179 [Aspergillus hiratsukae]|uniref:Short-chain dehydrogenase/reductase family protein n=1 Tax=Aspergillus hiratsukae TaxID=1194566 RepID=A0A8H6PEN1_9EURO|nr:hypothetical protein CNMCM5793_003179 [Aspergillus hiratsukae]